MKKSFIFIFCVVMLVMSAVTISAVEADTPELTMGKDAESQAILEAFSEYIQKSSTITQAEDGIFLVEFETVATGITLDEVLEQKSVVTVSTTPLNSAKLPDYSYTKNQTHTSVSENERYLYSLFNDQYKAIYRSVGQSLNNLQETTEYFSVSADDILLIYRSYLFDHAEFFYVSSACAIYLSGDKYAIRPIYAVGNQEGEYCGYGYGELTVSLKSKILAKKAVFDQTLSNFISTIPSNAPDYVKERLIYAKILRNSFYNLDAVYNNLWDGLANDNWTAYGILVNGYGVCESYAEAFQALCNAVGIPCTGVIGDAGGGHKWNAVKIAGRWYQCDITFDDPIGGAEGAAYSHYFNLTDEQMTALNHDWSSCDYPVPKCTATEYSRDNIFNIYTEDSAGTLHFFANKCDTTCENCNFTRYVSGHEYADDQSKICIHCGYNRPNGWTYENDNWYYYENNIPVRDAWRMGDNGERYLNFNGIMVTYDWVYKESIASYVFVGGDGYIVRNSWETLFGEIFYLDNNGCRTYSTFVEKDGRWAYLNTSGILDNYTGWINYQNNRYYLENSYRVENSWIFDLYGYRYLNEDGQVVVNDFVNDSDGLAYIESDGYLSSRTGWLNYNGKWYFLENGYAITSNWREDSIGWCYLGEDGAMLTNAWMQDSTGWCYLDESGYWDGVYHKSNRFEKNGWYKEDGIWYYYESDEKVINAWREDSTGWCFLDEEGKWVLDAFVKDSVGWAYITKDGYFYYDTNGWIKYYEDWYFLEGGYAVTNEWRKDSTGWCFLSETGAMVTNGFVEDSVGFAYITSDGYFYDTITDWMLIDGKWYYVSNGYAVTNEWRKDSIGWCYLGEDGAMYTNTWLKDSVGWCYIDENGYCLTNGTYTVNGHEYTFDADGRIQGEPIVD